MRRQFSIADLACLIAIFAVILAARQWLGYDGVILAMPYGGVIARKLFTRTIFESARSGRFRETLTASVVAIAVCLADPRPHATTAVDLAFGIPICVQYGFAAMGTLEGLLKTSRWLGGRVTRARSRCSLLMAGGLNTRPPVTPDPPEPLCIPSPVLGEI